MAYERTQENSQQSSNKPKAEGFLNLQLKDANGELHKVKAFIPLNTSDGQVNRSLINAAKNDPDRTYDIVGTVVLVAADSGEDLAL